MNVFNRGLYTFGEAAKLTTLRPSRVREWFVGRRAGKDAPPVFHCDYKPIDNEFAISFYDLIDLYVAGQLRDHGVSLQTVRKVHRQMKKDMRTSHPFCRKELLSDGKIVFMRGIDAVGEEELLEVLSRQKVFPEIILPFLQAIDYDFARMAKKWRIAEEVVIDPAICFGKPIIEECGIPTAILSLAYHANDDDAELVGEWYNVHPDYVLAAAQFEDKLAA